MENRIKIGTILTGVETILTGITTFFLLLILIAMPIDIMDFYADKETYVSVHHLNTNEKNWEWQYLDGWVYLGLLSIIGLTVITLRLIKRNNELIKKINWTFLFLFLGSVIIGFYTWMKTGFDH